MNKSPKKKCKVEKSLEKIEKHLQENDTVHYVCPKVMSDIRESFENLQGSIKEYIDVNVEFNSPRATQEREKKIQETVAMMKIMYKRIRTGSSEPLLEYPCNGSCGSSVLGNEQGLKFADNKWYCFACCQKQVNILVREHELLDPVLLLEAGYRDGDMKIIDSPEPKSLPKETSDKCWKCKERKKVICSECNFKFTQLICRYCNKEHMPLNPVFRPVHDWKPVKYTIADDHPYN